MAKQFSAKQRAAQRLFAMRAKRGDFSKAPKGRHERPHPAPRSRPRHEVSHVSKTNTSAKGASPQKKSKLMKAVGQVRRVRLLPTLAVGKVLFFDPLYGLTDGTNGAVAVTKSSGLGKGAARYANLLTMGVMGRSFGIGGDTLRGKFKAQRNENGLIVAGAIGASIAAEVTGANAQIAKSTPSWMPVPKV
jgi:hypothetical protein